MRHSEPILMGPGPCNPYPEAIEAFGRPVLGHLDPEFIAVLDETGDRLRQVYRTTNTLTFPVSGTGSAGMEAAFVNFLTPGDVAVVGVNGVFGVRMCDVAERAGAQVIRVDAPWGSAIDPEQLLSAHPDPAIIAVIHAETSTGVRNDIEPLGARKGDSLLVVDCVTSLGGIPLEVDKWGIDVAYSGTQKCLGVPPGLAPLTISDRAIKRIVERPQSWYLDLNMIAKYVSGDAGRAYHHTAPISMVYALHAGLRVVLDEGLEACQRRHQECGDALQAGLVEMGFELFAQDGHRLPELTTVVVPQDRIPSGYTEANIRARLLNEYGVEIGGGLGEFAGKVWRIGLMGHTARQRNVTLLLGALREILA